MSKLQFSYILEGTILVEDEAILRTMSVREIETEFLQELTDLQNEDLVIGDGTDYLIEEDHHAHVKVTDVSHVLEFGG